MKTTRASFEVGQVIDVDDGIKERPGVILEVRGDNAFISCGTKTARAIVGVFVCHPSPDAIMMGLTFPTYFYANSIYEVHYTHVKRNRGKASPGTLGELRRMLMARGMLVTRPLQSEHALLAFPKKVGEPA